MSGLFDRWRTAAEPAADYHPPLPIGLQVDIGVLQAGDYRLTVGSGGIGLASGVQAFVGVVAAAGEGQGGERNEGELAHRGFPQTTEMNGGSLTLPPVTDN